MIKTQWNWSSLVVQQVNAPALSLQWLWLLLWLGTAICCGSDLKKKKDLVSLSFGGGMSSANNSCPEHVTMVL